MSELRGAVDVHNRETEYQAMRSCLKGMDEPQDRLSELVALAFKEELTDRQREQMTLYYVNQMTMKAIADELGVSVSTVSRTLARGKKRLRHALRHYKQH